MTQLLALLLLLLPTPALAQVTPAAKPIVGHFDADGILDYGVWLPQPAPNQHKGQWLVRCSATGRVLNVIMSPGAPGTTPPIPVLADLDEDGKADVALWTPDNRTYYYWRSGAPGWFGTCRQLQYAPDCTYVDLAHVLAPGELVAC